MPLPLLSPHYWALSGSDTSAEHYPHAMHRAFCRRIHSFRSFRKSSLNSTLLGGPQATRCGLRLVSGRTRGEACLLYFTLLQPAVDA